MNGKQLTGKRRGSARQLAMASDGVRTSGRARVCGIAAALLLAGLGCRERPSRDACEKLMRHHMQLTAAPRGPKGMSPEAKQLFESSLASVSKELARDFVEHCRATWTAAEVDCQLQKKIVRRAGAVLLAFVGS